MSTKHVSRTEEMLGTVIEIKVPENFSHVFSECFGEIKRIENAYSRFLGNSELSKLNSTLGKWQHISDEFIFLLEQAKHFNKLTNGNFDITLKSVLDRLGYDKDYSFVEKKEKRAQILGDKFAVFLSPIKIDKKGKKVFLRKQIDFGGFGKGFALDRVASILNENKVKSYYIDAGGDIFAKQDKEPWEILLEHPDDTKNAIGKISLNGNAIAGSSSNRRKWNNNHHLINAKTKMPQNSVKAIFVIAKSGIEADAYSTALFTAGFEEGIILAMELGISALIISNENKMYKSEGFEAEIFSD